MLLGTVWSVDNFTGYQNMVPVPDDLGVQVFVWNVDGWSTLGDPRVDRNDRAAMDGTLSGPSYQSGKPVTISGKFKAPDVPTLLEWRDRFTGLLTSGDRTGRLSSAEPHRTTWMTVGRGGAAEADPVSSIEGTFSMILWADDPRRFADPLTASTGLPQVTGGLTLPMLLPFTLNSAVATGQCSLFNPGNGTGPVLARMWGPVVGASRITHVGSGNAVVFASSLSLADGQWIDIDMEGQQVLANGQVPRAEFVTNPGWSGFEEAGNTWAFAAENYTPGARVDITAWPTWF